MISRSVIAYVPVNLANLVISFGTIVILTRLLNEAEFGRYALAMVSLQFVHMGFFLWLEAAMERFHAQAEAQDDTASFLKTLYMAGMRLSVFIWAVLMVGMYYAPIPATLKPVLVMAFTSTCLQLFVNLGFEAHKASQRILRYSGMYSVQAFLGFSIGILLVMTTPLREVGPFVGLLVAILLVLCCELPFMYARLKSGVFKSERLKPLLKYGMPISLSLLLSYTLNSADLFILSAYLGDATVGAYNAGYNLANRSIDALFAWLGMAVTPIMIRALETEGVERSQEIIKNYGATLLFVILPAATGIALVAEPAGFILGESVRDRAVTVMPIIAFAGVINGFIIYFVHRGYMLSQRTDIFAWALVAPVVFNVGLNIWLVPRMGMMGAAWSTLASYIVAFVITFSVVQKYYRVPFPAKDGLKIALACTVMAIIVTVLPAYDTWADWQILALKASVGMIVYTVMCTLLNILNMRRFVKVLFQAGLSKRVMQSLLRARS